MGAATGTGKTISSWKGEKRAKIELILPQALDDLPHKLVVESSTVGFPHTGQRVAAGVRISMVLNSADNVWYGWELHIKYHLKKPLKIK